jgi:hypothetical protein
MGKFYGNQHVSFPEWEYDDLKEGVISFAAEHGEPPTTAEADSDDRFPCLSTIYRILDGSWNDLLEDAGLERGHVGEYGPEEEVKMLQDLRSVQQSLGCDYLTSRQYAEHGAYGDDTIKQTFGSWRTACERANIDAGEKYGIPCEGPNGETLDSLQELRVARALAARDIEYNVHPRVEDTEWRSDFYLPEIDLWVEVNGFAAGERPNAQDFQRKLEYYETQDLDCLVVESPDSVIEAVQNWSRK